MRSVGTSVVSLDHGYRPWQPALAHPSRWQRGLGLEGGEFDAELVGVGMVEVVEDAQGLPPGAVGGLGAAGGEVGLAEASEGIGFFVAVAEIPKQAQGVLVAGEGLG